MDTFLLVRLNETVQQNCTRRVDNSELNNFVVISESGRFRVENHMPFGLIQNRSRPLDHLPLMSVVGVVGHRCSLRLLLLSQLTAGHTETQAEVAA